MSVLSYINKQIDLCVQNATEFELNNAGNIERVAKAQEKFDREQEALDEMKAVLAIGVSKELEYELECDIKWQTRQLDDARCELTGAKNRKTNDENARTIWHDRANDWRAARQKLKASV